MTATTAEPRTTAVALQEIRAALQDAERRIDRLAAFRRQQLAAIRRQQLAATRSQPARSEPQ